MGKLPSSEVWQVPCSPTEPPAASFYHVAWDPHPLSRHQVGILRAMGLGRDGFEALGFQLHPGIGTSKVSNGTPWKLGRQWSVPGLASDAAVP